MNTLRYFLFSLALVMLGCNVWTHRVDGVVIERCTRSHGVQRLGWGPPQARDEESVQTTRWAMVCDHWSPRVVKGWFRPSLGPGERFRDAR